MRKPSHGDASIAAALILALLLSAGTAGGQTETPDRVFHQYMEAKRAGDWEYCVRLMHEQTLTRIRQTLTDALGADDSGEVLRDLFNAGGKEEFEKLTQVQVFSRLLDAMARNMPQVSLTSLAKPVMLGQVEESSQIRHIVYRQEGDVWGTTISSVEILTLQREGGVWRVQDTTALEVMVAMVRNFVASTDKPIGSIVLLSDTNGKLWIDDIETGSLVAGERRKIDLKPGRHWLAAKTEDGGKQWGRFVDVGSDESQDVIISLKSDANQVAPGASNPETSGGDAPIYLTGEVTPPERRVFVKPIYPEDAKKRKEQGKVILEIVVDREGNVTDTSVRQGNPTFDQASIQAVRQWKYKPAMMNGRPVKVYLTVIVDFSLKVDSSQP